jgi:hypothetical protein
VGPERCDRYSNATTSLLWAPTLQREYPEVEDYARFVRLVQPGAPWTFTRGDRSFEEGGILHADASVFDLFNWPLLQRVAAILRR